MKPIARVTGYYAGRCVVEPTNPAEVLPTGLALYDAYDAQAEITKRDEQIAELEQDLQTTADALAEVEQIRIGLENVRLFAARHRKEDWALLILGFCSEAGVVGSVLR